MSYYDSYKSATRIDLDNVGSFRAMKELILQSNMKLKNPVILDIGCGIGYLADYFVRNQLGTVWGGRCESRRDKYCKKPLSEC